jgi:tetratricopeptide (TPR) repeat protein
MQRNETNQPKRPKYQVVIVQGFRLSAAALIILGAFVNVLDWLNYSLLMISNQVACIATIVIGVAWFSTQVVLRRRGLLWLVDGKLRRVRGIGNRYAVAVLGLVLILWVGPIVHWFRNLPAFKVADNSEILVVISKFQLGENVPDSEAYNRIKVAIENSRDELKLANLRVEIEPHVTLQDNDFRKAEALGDKYNATIVIWGAETRVDLTVNFYNLRVTKLAAAKQSISELVMPDEYSQLVVQDLPNRVKFLALLTIGDILSTNGEHDKAIEVVQGAINSVASIEIGSQEKHSLAEAYFRLGNLYGDEGKHAKATDAFSTAIGIYPYASHTYNNRGTSRLRLDEYLGAREDFDTAIKLDPEYSLAYNNRGILRALQEDYSGAIEDHTKAIELWPQYSNAYAMRGKVWNLIDKNDLALKDLTRSIELNPKHAIAYLLRAFVYIEEHNDDLALTDFSVAIDLNPLDGQAYYYRALVYERLGEYDKASADRQRADVIGHAEGYPYSQELDK